MAGATQKIFSPTRKTSQRESKYESNTTDPEIDTTTAPKNNPL